MHHVPVTRPRSKGLPPRMACPPRPQRFQIPYDGEIVYFARVEETGNIKIGTTRQWETRVSGLCRDHGTITLIGTEPGYRSRESAVHRLFWRERISPTAELFSPSQHLMDYVADLNDGEDPIVYRALPPWLREVATADFAANVVDTRRRPTDAELAEWADLL